MDQTILFWRDFLGMRLIARFGRPGNLTCFFEAQAGMLIAFMEWEGVEPIGRKENSVPVEGPFACDHLSLAVGSDDELRALKDRLSAAGFAASEINDHGFIHSLSTFDPNTIAREFTSDVPRIDLHGHPLAADHDPTPIAAEGPEPQPGRWPPVTARTPVEKRRMVPGSGQRPFLGRDL